MRYLNRLLAFKRLVGQQWYHQRFDGAPLYLFFVGEAEVAREKRKPAGTEANLRVCFFKEGKADWYLAMDDIKRGADKMVKLAKQYPLISKKLLQAWATDEEKFQKFFNDLAKINLNKLSDHRLLGLYKKYYRLSINRFTSSSIIDHFALGTDELIAEKLRQEIGPVNKKSVYTKIFSIITAPVHQSFINKAEMDLLKIAINCRDKKNNKKKFLNQETVKYQRRYFWINNNYYSAKILTAKYFQKEIITWLNSGAGLKSKYNQLKNTPQLNKIRKLKLFKKYKFSQHLKTLIKISEDFTWWQDERKKATYLNIHLGTLILTEMARRRGVNRELTKFLVPAEVEQWFLIGKPTQTQLKARLKNCGIAVWRDGYYITVGREVEKLKRIIFPKQDNDKIGDLRGLPASVGRVIGKVKVVKSALEVSKVEKGDILVAVMTRPDYIVAMRQAAAIITNEGGITSHAAIVSRELGIPCIIGTKIATEILKDGDKVEVNANHGVVKILERKNRQ